MQRATFPVTLPPDRALAIDAMRLALAEERAELDEAADYAETFAREFFRTGSVRFAAARATMDLDRARADRGATDSVRDMGRN